MSIVIKLLAALISALIGLILIPLLAGDTEMKALPLLLVYFLPGFCVALIIFFELLTRIERLKPVYAFVQSQKMVIVFIVLLTLEWLIIWLADSHHDIVFISMFATGVVPAVLLYSWLGQKWKVLPRA